MKNILISLLIFCAAPSSANKHLKSIIEKAARTTSSISTNLILAENIELDAEIVVTSKGNGSLKVGSLELKIYDDHNNGMVFGEEGIDINLEDLDSDGIKELIISGVLVYTGEEETASKSYSYFVRGYKYHPQDKKFENILAIGDYQPDLNAE